MHFEPKTHNHTTVGTTSGNKTQIYEYGMSRLKLETIQCVKDLGVTIVSNLNFCQNYKDTAAAG